MKTILKFIWRYFQKNQIFREILSNIYNLFSCNIIAKHGRNIRLTTKGAFIHNCQIKIYGENDTIIIGKSCLVSNQHIRITGSNSSIIIGEGCELKKGNILIEDSNCKIVIGNKTTIEGALIKAAEPFSKIEIGEDCMLGDEVEIRTSDMHSIIDLTSGIRLNHAKNIKIDNHVWLGAHVIVLKGSKIGSDSIIGIGSIVTKYIPSNSIAAGVPASIIKSNVTWSRYRIIDEE